ncbi:MAG: hypothetical protein K8I00_01360, partial [Candidatus Omnitrophica bacterium]|nr:hypothetical protein [Candidatus Omnitrophota bacterium]
YYVYDANEVIEEYNSSNVLQADYVMGSRIDEPLTMTRSSSTYYYLTDGLGSVRQLANASGTIAESYNYDPYGNTTIYDSSLTDITSTGSGIDNPYMFTGRRMDKETGVYHYRRRAYDPGIGRFLQRDPLGYWDSMNLYEYVMSNPVNMVDPFGTNYWVVKLIEGGIKVGRKVGFEAAKKIRQAGGNILARRKKSAEKLQKAASSGGKKGNKGFKKHKDGHQLKDRNGDLMFDDDGNPLQGRPHFQDDEMLGHTFWGVMGGLGDFLLDMLDGATPADAPTEAEYCPANIEEQ